MRTFFGRGKKLQLAVTSCCLCAFVLFRYDQGVFGGILENADWQKQSGHPGDTLTGLITANYNLGCLLGCFVNFFIGEKLGRRRTIWFAMSWIIIGAALQASAFTRPHLIIGRIVTGLGTGLKTSTVPMAEALDALSAVYDKPGDHPDIIREANSIEIALNIEAEAEGSASWASTFRKDNVNTRYRIFLAWFVQFMNQAGSINLVVYYILTVLRDNVGLEHTLAQIIAGCIQLMFPIGSLLPSLALDRMGRRSTMIWGSAGLCVSMLLASALLSQADKANGKAYVSGSVAFFFTYMLVFGASMNCVPWVYVPEILPLHARTRGTAIGVSSNWLWNFTVVMITPILIKRLKWKAYLIFTATNLAFVPIIIFYPETSNLALEEVDYIFTEPKNPVTVARQMQKEIAQGGQPDTERLRLRKEAQGGGMKERKSEDMGTVTLAT
ncbi:Fc.00g010550.m01.CDS01 [Cosmosporella sp. VM-42]